MSNDQDAIDLNESKLVFHNKAEYRKLHKDLSNQVTEMQERLNELDFMDEVPTDDDIEDSIILIEDLLAESVQYLDDINPKSMLTAELELLQATQKSLDKFDDVLDKLEEIQDTMDMKSDSEDDDDLDDDGEEPEAKKGILSVTPIQKTGTSFSKIGGMASVKEKLMNICYTINNHERVARAGGDVQKTILLYGPPGTGKTESAKAIATETKSPIIMVDGATFASKYIGDEKKGLEKVLRMAEENLAEQEENGTASPSIVLFFDEIEELVKERGPDHKGGSEGLITLMTRMNEGRLDPRIIIIAATNKYDMIDDAIRDRFKNHTMVPRPDLSGRHDILKIMTKPLSLSANVDLKSMAKQTHGLSGRGLKKIVMGSVDEMILRGRREGINPRVISAADCANALDTEILGLESKLKLSALEKEATALHEAGHAITGLLLEHTGIEPLDWVSIVPRDESLGLTSFNAEKDNYQKTYAAFKAELVMCLGGRAAEELVYGEEGISSGASGDIEMVTDITLSMITQSGFSKRMGLLNINSASPSAMTGKSIKKSFSSSSSPDLTNIMHEEAKSLAHDAYEEAKNLLRENPEALLNLSKALIKKRTIYREEALDITGITPKKKKYPSLSSLTAAHIQNG